jgi:hypothetical protein
MLKESCDSKLQLQVLYNGPCAESPDEGWWPDCIFFSITYHHNAQIGVLKDAPSQLKDDLKCQDCRTSWITLFAEKLLASQAKFSKLHNPLLTSLNVKKCTYGL